MYSIGAVFAGVASAQDAPATGEPTREGVSAEREPTLDELLGLPGTPGEAATPAGDPGRRELDRQLEGEAATGDDFRAAVSLMEDASKRLSESRDAGDVTQRLQADVLKRLDKIIQDAQRQQANRSSKGQQGQQQPRQDPGQQQQQGSKPESQQGAAPGTQAGAGNVPAVEPGSAGPRAGGTARWGNLPEHVREALRQGLSDAFSSMYRRKTEEYYKRLAEDRAPGDR